MYSHNLGVILFSSEFKVWKLKNILKKYLI